MECRPTFFLSACGHSAPDRQVRPLFAQPVGYHTVEYLGLFAGLTPHTHASYITIAARINAIAKMGELTPWLFAAAINMEQTSAECALGMPPAPTCAPLQICRSGYSDDRLTYLRRQPGEQSDGQDVIPEKSRCKTCITIWSFLLISFQQAGR